MRRQARRATRWVIRRDDEDGFCVCGIQIKKIKWEDGEGTWTHRCPGQQKSSSELGLGLVLVLVLILLPLGLLDHLDSCQGRSSTESGESDPSRRR